MVAMSSSAVSVLKPSYSISSFADNGTSTKSHLFFWQEGSPWSFVSQLAELRAERILYSQPTTNGFREVAVIPQLAIGSNKTVCTSAIDAVEKLPPSSQKRLAISLLTGIRSYILSRSEYRGYTRFNKIHYTYMKDDNAIVLEWAYRDGRVTYFIDEDINESIAIFIDDLNSTGHPIISEYDIKVETLPQIIAESIALVAKLAS